MYTGERKIEHVFHISVVHGYLNLGFQEFRSLYNKGIHAIIQPGDVEGSILARSGSGNLSSTLHENEFGVLDRLPAIAVDHRTLDAAGGLRAQGNARQYGCRRQQVRMQAQLVLFFSYSIACHSEPEPAGEESTF